MATSNYDGSDFVGLDDDAIGDGSSDETEPLDTWLQHRLQSNIEYLAAEPRMIVLAPFMDAASTINAFAGHRPYLQHVWGTVWSGLLEVQRGQTGFRFSVAYQDDTAGSTMVGTVEVRVRVGAGDVAAAASVTATLTSVDSDIGFETIEVTFPPSTVAELRRVVFEVRSTVTTSEDTAIGKNTDGYSVDAASQGFDIVDTNAQGSGNEFWAANSTTGNPDADSREAMYAQQQTAFGTYTNAANRPILDIMGVEGSGSNTRALCLQRPLELDANALTAGSCYARFGHMFFLRGLGVESVFDKGRFKEPRLNLAPNIVVGAAEAFRQFSAAHSLAKQHRLIAMGPRGMKDSNTDKYYDLGYALRWPFTFGDDTGEQQVLVRDSVSIESDVSRLLCVTQWISTQTTHNAWNVSDSASTVGKNESELVGELTPGRVIWNITYSLAQLNDKVGGTADKTTHWADNSTQYGDHTEAEQFELHPAAELGDDLPPVARGINHMVQGNRTKGGAEREAALWFKEGSLFTSLGDDAYVQTRFHEIPITALTETQTQWPFRFDIKASWSSTPDAIDIVQGEESVGLRLVSYALFEVYDG